MSTEWQKESAFQTARKLPQKKYPHLIDDTEFWFPVDFEKPFTAPTITKGTAAVGSSIRLLAELEELNRRTWNAGEDQIAEWRAQGAEYNGPFEKSAQMGFAVFYELSRLSVQHRLPMKLDY